MRPPGGELHNEPLMTVCKDDGLWQLSTLCVWRLMYSRRIVCKVTRANDQYSTNLSVRACVLAAPTFVRSCATQTLPPHADSIVSR